MFFYSGASQSSGAAIRAAVPSGMAWQPQRALPVTATFGKGSAMPGLPSSQTGHFFPWDWISLFTKNLLVYFSGVLQVFQILVTNMCNGNATAVLIWATFPRPTSIPWCCFPFSTPLS